LSFKPPGSYIVVPRCAHTIFLPRQGAQIKTVVVFYHPCNAFDVQNDACTLFDQLAWGIEAQQWSGGRVSNHIFL